MPRDERRRQAAEERLLRAWRDDRGYVLTLATRMLGDPAAADDVVQVAYSRLALADIDTIDNVRAWLVVVVRRLCLDRVRSAHARHETVTGDDFTDVDQPTLASAVVDPADRITLDDEVQAALSVVLDRLTPAERTVFVLHDVFGYPFDDVASLVGRTPAACRQLASRARASIHADRPLRRASYDDEQRRLLSERFAAACAGGDLDALMALLDPNVAGGAVLVTDGGTIGQTLGRSRGRPIVARRLLTFIGPDSGAVLVPVALTHHAGLAVIYEDELAGIIRLEERDGRITHVDTFALRLPPQPLPHP